MEDPTDVIPQAARREPWNKGKFIGAQPPLGPKARLVESPASGKWPGEHATWYFNLAIDSKLPMVMLSIGQPSAKLRRNGTAAAPPSTSGSGNIYGQTCAAGECGAGSCRTARARRCRADAVRREPGKPPPLSYP